jgi:Fungal specific transcription factor domain
LFSDEQSDFILGQLRSGKNLDIISNSLEGIGPYTASDAISLPPRSEALENNRDLHSSGRGGISQARRFSQTSIDASSTETSGKQPHILPTTDRWTAVTEDKTLIEHLMALYFCWEYPIYAGLSRPYFLADFKAFRRRYCSSLLVNAILAVGNQFSGNGGTEGLYEKRTKAFAREAERLLSIEGDTASLTTVQALGIMSVYEAREGKEKQSMFYSGQSIRMAVDMGLHLDLDMIGSEEGERAVGAATLWGAFALDL